MEVAETLASIAEVSATLLGFAAVFRAFRGELADQHSAERTLLVIEVGLVIVFMCYLPSVLMGAGLEASSSYRIISAFTALYWLRWFALSYRLKDEDHATPVLFRVAVGFHVMIFSVCSVAALGVLPKVGIVYLAVVIAILALVGMAFLAQFMTETST